MLRFLLLFLIIVTSADARSVVTNRPSTAATCTGGYQGPGDVKATATVGWGLRAYNCATAGAQVAAVILCTPLDAACETENVNPAGDLALGTVGATCNITSVICTAKTLIDQPGGGAHNITNATIANRPAFVPACVGSRPCLSLVSTSSQTLCGTIPTIAQPLGMSAVATFSSASFGRIISTFTAATTEPDMFWNPTSNQLTFNAGGSSFNLTGTPGTSGFFAIQASFQGSGSGAIINGTSGGASLGTTSTSTSVCVGSTTNGLAFATEKFTEGYIWPAAFGGSEATNMQSNERAYWGF